MRLFIGIEIPDEIKDRIGEVSCKLQSKVREARVVSPANLHITLKFLGEVPEEEVPHITGILSDILKDYVPFRAEVKGAGVFPDEKNVRVFWIGADSGGKLKKLNALIENRLETEGFKKENRFREHITIARFKSNPRISFLKELIEKYKEETFGVMDVREVELIKSNLKPSGPTYTPLHKIPLAKQDGH